MTDDGCQTLHFSATVVYSCVHAKDGLIWLMPVCLVLRANFNFRIHTVSMLVQRWAAVTALFDVRTEFCPGHRDKCTKAAIL